MKSLQQLLASCFSPPSSHLTQLPWFLSGHPAAKLCLAHSLPFSLLFAPSAWTPLGPDLLPVALSHHSGLSSNATTLMRASWTINSISNNSSIQITLSPLPYFLHSFRLNYSFILFLYLPLIEWNSIKKRDLRSTWLAQSAEHKLLISRPCPAYSLVKKQAKKKRIGT